MIDWFYGPSFCAYDKNAGRTVVMNYSEGPLEFVLYVLIDFKTADNLNLL